jgi:hypothetical protein
MKRLKWMEHPDSEGEWWYVKDGGFSTPDYPDGININATTKDGWEVEFRLSDDDLDEMWNALRTGRAVRGL